MKWLGNAPKQDASREIAKLCSGWIGRRVVEGEPQATDLESVETLQSKGMVGLYHVGAGEPVTVEVHWGSAKLERAGEAIRVGDALWIPK
jgi:hypothetical protein